MKCYRLANCLPLVLILGGCAALEALGLATPEGEPTDTASAISGLLGGLTGIDVLALWKAGEALFTKRGRDNLKTMFSPKTGAKVTVQSVLALLAGTHTPEAAKAKG